MKALVKADFQDNRDGVLRRAGEIVEMTASRIDEVNAAFPGILEKRQAKKPTKN